MRQRGWRKAIKVAIDRVAAAAALLLLSPLILLVGAIVRIGLGSPVLFRQKRPGYRGAIFEVFKFRTMTDRRDETGALLPDHLRLTRLGRFLRASSLDELPQLLNVLRGDLSLVGPRPLLVQYLGRYSPEQARRHDVLPGVTGWAQINGRNAIDWDQKLAMDVWYVDNWSLSLDFRILALTLNRVFKRSGVSHGGHVTMPEFQGSKPKE